MVYRPVSRPSADVNATTVQQEVSKLSIDANAEMMQFLSSHKDVPVPVNETRIIKDITPEQNVSNAELVEVDNEIDVNINNDLSKHYTANPALNFLDNLVHDSAQALAADGSSVSAAEIATCSDQLLQEINAVSNIIENQHIKDASQPIDTDGFQLVISKSEQKNGSSVPTGILVHFPKPHPRQNYPIV